jgi:hypothetical protein
MASKNHVYYELQDHTYKRYVKTPIGILAGMRVNPHDITQRVPFLLQSDERRVAYEKDEYGFDKSDKIATIAPPTEDDILETYSEEEDRVFRRINAALFAQGLLVETTAPEQANNHENALTDTQIADLCNNWLRFKKHVPTITASITLDRIEQHLKALNRNQRWFDVVHAQRTLVMK